jgi:drug/metabolite transporter (DMT)-like permease
MTWAVFAAALASAFLHATWNMLAKTRLAPQEIFVGIVLATASICAVLIMIVGIPSADTWPWMTAAAVCNVIYVRLAIRAYAASEFGVVYAVVRAIIPPTMFLVGWLLMAEAGRLSGVAGLVLVAVSLLLFSRHTTNTIMFPHGGFGLSIVAGLLLAMSLLLDVIGIRAGGLGLPELMSYTAVSSLTTATLLILHSIVKRANPFAALVSNPGQCYLGAALLLLSYLCGMWAYAHGPLGLVAPIREGGILFSGLLAGWVLRERITQLQWLAMVFATAGVVLIQLG